MTTRTEKASPRVLLQAAKALIAASLMVFVAGCGQGSEGEGDAAQPPQPTKHLHNDHGIPGHDHSAHSTSPPATAAEESTSPSAGLASSLKDTCEEAERVNRGILTAPSNGHDADVAEGKRLHLASDTGKRCKAAGSSIGDKGDGNGQDDHHAHDH